MKQLLLIGCLTFCSASALYSVDPARLAAIHDEQSPHYHYISSKEIKSYLDKNRKVTLVDARSKTDDDGNRLPGAKYLPYDAAENDIVAALPDKEAEIIVYCSGPSCPASKYLATRLVHLGYSNVYKYNEGIDGWVKSGYWLAPKKD